MHKYMICITFGLLITASSIVNADRVFKYPRVQQEKDNWCWSASSQWILGFHGMTLTQTKICEYGFTDGVVRNQWNWIYTATDNGLKITSGTSSCYGRGINQILKYFGIPNKIKPGSNANYILSEDEFKNEIDNGHPFVVRYALDGGGHFVVAIGYQNKMCWLMNPWKDDGIQIYDYDWVKNGTDPARKHHTWDYTLQTTRIDTIPDLVTQFPSSILPGTGVSLVLTSNLNGRDVTKSTYFTSLTKGVKIDSVTRTISWTQTEAGPASIQFIREYGNARDTIMKSFNGTNINRHEFGTHSSPLRIEKSGDAYTITISKSYQNSHISTLHLYSTDGTKVFSDCKTTPSGTVFSLKKSSFAPGVYLVSIVNGHDFYTEKLLF